MRLGHITHALEEFGQVLMREILPTILKAHAFGAEKGGRLGMCCLEPALWEHALILADQATDVLTVAENVVRLLDGGSGAEGTGALFYCAEAAGARELLLRWWGLGFICRSSLVLISVNLVILVSHALDLSLSNFESLIILISAHDVFSFDSLESFG